MSGTDWIGPQLYFLQVYDLEEGVLLISASVSSYKNGVVDDGNNAYFIEFNVYAACGKVGL